MSTTLMVHPPSALLKDFFITTTVHKERRTCPKSRNSDQLSIQVWSVPSSIEETEEEELWVECESCARWFRNHPFCNSAQLRYDAPLLRDVNVTALFSSSVYLRGVFVSFVSNSVHALLLNLQFVYTREVCVSLGWDYHLLVGDLQQEVGGSNLKISTNCPTLL